MKMEDDEIVVLVLKSKALIDCADSLDSPANLEK